MILIRFLVIIIFVNIVFGKFDAPLPTKENVGEYLTEQFLKSDGFIPEKYDGPVYDDMNVVIDNNVNEPFKFDSNDTSVEDEPKLFTFDPQEAPLFRGKRQTDFQQPSAPVRSSATGAAIVAHVDSTSDIVPYDAHVDPDFPAEAPVARGLKNVPEGWNLDKEIDYEFQRGYRKGSTGINSSYSGQHQHGGSGMETSGGGGVEGPYMDSGSSAPLSMGGSNYGGSGGYGGGMDSGYGNMGSSGYGSMGSSGYGNMGNGYGGGMNSGYGGLGNSYGGMSNGGYGGLGSGYGSNGLGGYSGYGNTGGYGGLGGLGQSYGGLGQGYGGYGGYGSMG